jgi:SAM-dependent methyltransferase
MNYSSLRKALFPAFFMRSWQRRNTGPFGSRSGPVDHLANRSEDYSMTLAQRLDRLTQTVLAPGATAHLMSKVGELMTAVRPAGLILDVGCGYTSPLAALGRTPVVVDLDEARVRLQGGRAVAADAVALPFADGVFAAAFSFGLLHHLDDGAARNAIGEMRRVVRPDGLIAIFDGVLPIRSRAKPAAALIRAFDRGSHMRTQAALRVLFDDPAMWSFDRVTYAATGLEGLWCVRGARRAERP